ncbi:MAG TPA: hypothetical protein VGM90_34160 [Kofleriaceae bacterium]
MRWLSSPRAPWIVIAIAIALAAPALTATFTADDHVHRVVSRDETKIAGMQSRPFDRFVFADGTPTTNVPLRDVGLFPWYVDPHLKLAFARPISSVTHQIDMALWPDNATLHLAHNLLWHALSLVMVWFLFTRFLGMARPVGSQELVTRGRWVAVLALALYAFDDARGPVVGWIANRNSLVALVFAIPVLLLHDIWRRGAPTSGDSELAGGSGAHEVIDASAHWRRVAPVLAPVLFALSLGAGESAIAIAAYLFAYELWLDKAPLKSRALALAPYVVVVLAWRALYAHLGYGVGGSGVYLDPGSQAGLFLHDAVTRVPFLLAGQFSLLWSDLASFYPVVGTVIPMLLIAGLALGSTAFAAARILVRDPVARFFATGAVLSAIPVASTFPADRLLGFIGLGGAGLVAQVFAAALRDRSLLGDGKLRRIVALVVIVGMALVHVVAAPPLLVLRSRSMVAVGRVIDRAEQSIPSDPSIVGKTVVIMSAPSDALAGFITVMRESMHRPRPMYLHWLAVATSEVTIERVDDRTLRVTPAGGLLRWEIDQMMRSAKSAPFHVGDRVDMPRLSIEIEKVTDDGRPAQYLARFAAPMEDPSYVLLTWRGKGYAPYTPPAIGASEVLPTVNLFKLLD